MSYCEWRFACATQLVGGGAAKRHTHARIDGLINKLAFVEESRAARPFIGTPSQFIAT